MDKKENIIDFLEGRLKGSQREEFLSWLEEEPQNKNEYFKQKDLWDAYRMHGQRKGINVQQEWRHLEQRILKSKPVISLTERKSVAYWIRVAAMVVVVFGLGWGANVFVDQMQNSKPLSHQLEVPRGQRSKLMLADGTTVWLNSDSKLSFSDHSINGERIVNLEGEAFFDVARDEQHPFVVHSKGQSIKVLGTAFNVRAYKEDEDVVTTLERGKVEVTACGRRVLLSPGQQLKWSRMTQRLNLRQVETNYFTVWRDGRYVFENEEFDDLMNMVERWYDVKFVYPKEYFKNMHYSGVIKRIKPLEHVLNLINYTTPIEYEINGDEVVIKPKKQDQ